jgi:hypothetical protein
MTFEEEIQSLPNECRTLLASRDGGWRLSELLPKLYPPEQVSNGGARPWEVCGIHLKSQRRFHEALIIFERLYLSMLDYEIQTKRHVMKGMPMVWMSDCHQELGRRTAAKRFIILTLIEDAIASGGTVSPEHHGSYFRAAWIHALSHDLISRYAKEAYSHFQTNQTAGPYPEWVLQQLDQEWISGCPTAEEVHVYPVNRLPCVSPYKSWGRQR